MTWRDQHCAALRTRIEGGHVYGCACSDRPVPPIIVRVTRFEGDGVFGERREWYELRETEEEMFALANSVYENHPTGYMVDCVELQGDAPMSSDHDVADLLSLPNDNRPRGVTTVDTTLANGPLVDPGCPIHGIGCPDWCPALRWYRESSP